MKKYVCFVGLFALFALCVVTFASTEQERRLEYSLTAIGDVTTMQNWMGEINGNWSTNVVTPFIGGVAESTLDLSWGPALYNAYASWNDTKGYSLFNSYGSIKKIESGMNYMDFPMYISYWRCISIKFKQPGVTSDSQIWINGSPAWFDGEYWCTYIGAPWNVTELTILWGGHGQWIVGTSPTFGYGQPVLLSLADMDPTVTAPSQAFGVAYLGELSNPTTQVVFVSGVEYDQTIGANVLVCCNTLYKKYGSFKVMVMLQNYDPNLGNSIQYFSQYVTVLNGTFMVPLVNHNWQNIGIPDYTSVRFIYEDPSDGGTCKQQWDNSLYTSPNN